MSNKMPKGESFTTRLEREQSSKEAVANNEFNRRRFRLFQKSILEWSDEQITKEVNDNGVLQFSFRPLWRSIVLPMKDDADIQSALDAGMNNLDASWQRGDAPWEAGQDSCDWKPAPKADTLEYYQPQNRCYYMVLFALHIGKRVFPRLDWRIMLNERHSIAVGVLAGSVPSEEAIQSFQDRDKIVICMDLLFSDRNYTAKHSIDFADPKIGNQAYFDQWVF